MSVIKTIKFCAQFAWTIAKTLASVPGAAIRNAVQEAKKRRSGESAKGKWVLSFQAPYGVVIGFIGTRWDNAPAVAIATACFELKVEAIEAIAQETAGADASPEVMAPIIAEALRANLHVDDLGQFSRYIAVLLGHDAWFAEGIAQRHEGFVVNLKLKDNKLRVRVSLRGSPYDVMAVIHRVDNMRGDYGHDHIPRELMLWFELPPEKDITAPDEDIIGKVEVQEGLAAQAGQPITLTREGWREASAMKAAPGQFPAPRVPEVTRLPASALD